MYHQMRLSPAPFEQIQCGKKTIELRLWDEKRRLIHIGDTICFTNTQDANAQLRARVTALHRFESFEALYAALPLLQCGYDEETIKFAHPSDMEQYYSSAEQKSYGVVGIELTLEFITKI